jgi:hypothetical protein
MEPSNKKIDEIGSEPSENAEGVVGTEAFPEQVKWSIRQRYEFIEFRLLWEGRVNRRDLVERFGLSAQQSSADIAAYDKFSPGNLAYDSTLRSYVRGKDFHPALVSPQSDRHLRQLVAIKNGWIRREETWFEALPPAEVVSIPRKSMEPRHLQFVLDAIRQKLEMKVDYRSVRPELTGQTRHIVPHALGFGSNRWHVRAWCREHNQFRDFNLNRIQLMQEPQPAPAHLDATHDLEWSYVGNAVVAPNPELSEETKASLEFEYGMTNGELAVPVRLALLFYFMTDNNLDVEPGILPSSKQQLLLKNREEIQQLQAVVRRMSNEQLARLIPNAMGTMA